MGFTMGEGSSENLKRSFISASVISRLVVKLSMTRDDRDCFTIWINKMTEQLIEVQKQTSRCQLTAVMKFNKRLLGCAVAESKT